MTDEQTNAVLDVMDLIYADPTTDPDVLAIDVRALAVAVVASRLPTGAN